MYLLIYGIFDKINEVEQDSTKTIIAMIGIPIIGVTIFALSPIDSIIYNANIWIRYIPKLSFAN